MDVLQLTPTQNGNEYSVVFMDYFTEWPEVFAVPYQSAETIAELLVENLICRHRVPKELSTQVPITHNQMVWLRSLTAPS